MDPRVLSRFYRFKLQEEEEAGVSLEHADILTSKDECARSLIGKVHWEKIANYTGLKNILTIMWHSTGCLQIKELWDNLFQVVFTNQGDKMRALNEKSWTFDSQFLVLKQWDENMDFQIESFNKVQLWV